MFFITWLLLVVLLYLLVWLYKRFKCSKSIDSFFGWLPRIKYGLSLIFMNDIFTFIKAIGNYSISNGGVSVFQFGWKSVYVITNPEDATVVLSKCLEKMFVYKYIKPLFGDILVAAEGAVWLRTRRIADLGFKQNILNSYLKVFNSQANCLVNALEKNVNGDYFDVTDEITLNVLETACQTTLDLNKDGETIVNNIFVKAIHRVFEIVTLRVKKPWLILDVIFNHLNLKKELDQSLAIIHETSDKMVKIRKSEQLARIKTGEKDDVEIRSFLHILLEHSTTLEGSILTDLQVRSLCDNVMLASFDTSTYELLFTLVCIGSDRNVQERIYQEITEVLGEETTVTQEHISRMSYLEAAIKEALRLYPIGPVVARDATTDVQLGQVTIPAGSSIVVHLWAINRREEYWGPDAEEYNPGRWLNSDIPKHPNAFASFSFGRRNCIGKFYSMMHMKTTLAHILRKYRLTSDHKRMQFDLYIMLKAKSGHLIKLELR